MGLNILCGPTSKWDQLILFHGPIIWPQFYSWPGIMGPTSKRAYSILFVALYYGPNFQGVEMVLIYAFSILLPWFLCPVIGVRIRNGPRMLFPASSTMDPTFSEPSTFISAEILMFTYVLSIVLTCRTIDITYSYCISLRKMQYSKRLKKKKKE